MKIRKLVSIIAAEAVLCAVLTMPATANGGAPAPPVPGDGSCGSVCKAVKCLLFAIYCLFGVDNIQIIGPAEQRDQNNYTVVYGKPESA